MKILIVTQYFWPESFKINDLCTELAERGHEVTVYTGLPNYPEGFFYKGYSLFKGPYREMFGKVKVIRSPLIPRGKKKSLMLGLNFFSYAVFASLLAPFSVRGKYDKIFVYQPSPVTVAIPGIVLKYLKGAPMFLWVTDLWPESLEATGVVKNKKILSLVALVVKWIYRRSDKILATSKGFIPRITGMGISEKKVQYWSQWAETFFEDNVQLNYKDSNIPDSGFKIMFAGNIGTSQDFKTIVEAANILKEEKNIHFLILGDGLMKRWAEEEVVAKKLQSTFHFLGRKPVEFMPYYYSHANVMLMSLTDTDLFSITIPSKLQSYLASGKPILASMNGEGADIVREWRAGMTCPATNPKLLAETILAMSKLSKPDLEEMGKNAFNCYRSEFERDKLISVLENEFRTI